MSEFKPTPWPTLPLPRTAAEWARLETHLGGRAKLIDWVEKRERAIANEQADALGNGYEPPHWKRVRQLLGTADEILILGGNRSGKSSLTGKLGMELLVHRAGSNVAYFHTSEDTSKTIQQPILKDVLPPEYRGLGKPDAIANIKYSQKGGFTEGTFVLPPKSLPIGQAPWWGGETEAPFARGRGSQCWFHNYGQYEKDPKAFEGGEYDLIVLDEPCPPSLLATLRFRKGPGRVGKIIVTYTPVDGYDLVCKDFMEGARVVEELPVDHQMDKYALLQPNRSDAETPRFDLLNQHEVHVPGCRKGHMPFILQKGERRFVIFFWTFWNAYLGEKELRSVLRPEDSKPRRMMRAYGYAEKLAGNMFPRFNPNVHVIPHDKVPAAGTDYMAADPALARSYFCLWVRVDELGRKFVFDESPRADEGQWVTLDGQRGDGQKCFAGRGTDWYKAHIWEREREHGQEVVLRSGDPRAFATQAAAKEGGMSLMELFSQESDGGAGMYFEPAPVRATIGADCEIINSWLSYNEDKPISVENEPKLYISERCQNLIQCLMNWSAQDGLDNVWKDGVDALRYVAVCDPQYQDPNAPEVVKGMCR